ncbi:MAG: hypothetical protein KAI66_23030, partial [Lentisphaeria bacterium]|nr:hypothetical protein [Lentisphaeria bacterium]
AEMRLKALTRFRDARTLESYLKNAADFANLCDDKELTSRLERIAASQEFAKALIAYPGVGRDGAMTAANLKRALVKVPEDNPYWHKLLSERLSTLTLHDENVAKVATSIGDLKENESFVRAWRVNFSLPDPDDEQLLLRMKSGFLLTKKLAEANAQEDPLYYGERLGEIYAERLIQRDVQIPNPSKRDLKRRKYIGMPRIAYKSYVPETEDTEAVFEEEEIYIRGRTIPKLLPHCAYIRSLLGQYEAIRTGSPVLFLLLRTAELHQVWLASADGPDRATAELEPRVVLLLMVDFIGHLERLVGTWCLPPSLLEFKEDAGKLELETNWFCQNTRSYRLERNEIVHLLRKEKYRFNPVRLINECSLRVAATDVCLARGVEWVGRRGV